MNFLDLLNSVARVAKPTYDKFNPIQDMETKFRDTDIDSLDGMLIVMYMGVIYGIDDEITKHFTPTSPQELYDFMQMHKQVEPKSIEEALELIK